MTPLAALPDFASLALRLGAYLAVVGAAVALVVAIIRVISLLISFAQDERHGKLALVARAVGFPLGCCFILGALGGGVLFYDSVNFGKTVVAGMVVVLR